MLKKILFFTFISSSVFAQNIHFFGSVKTSQTSIKDDDITFDSISNHPTVAPLTTAGLSIDASLNEKFQVLSQFLLKNGKFMGVDLLQMRYFVEEGFMLRVGKQRLPSNLHSENIQVQALLPWMTAPREIYSRAPIYSFTGLSAEKKLGDYFGVHAYAGDTQDNFEGERADYVVETENLLGLRLNFKIDSVEAFANYYQTEGNVDISSAASLSGIGLPSGTEGTFNQNYRLNKIHEMSAGIQFKPKDFFILSEYSLLTSKNPLMSRVEGASFSLGKDLNEKWTSVATFSTDLDVVSSLSPTKTATYAFNLNYRLDFNNVFKIGYEHINYKEITVDSGLSAPLPTTTNASILTNGSPGQNFDVYSLMWAFVY